MVRGPARHPEPRQVHRDHHQRHCQHSATIRRIGAERKCQGRHPATARRRPATPSADTIKLLPKCDLPHTSQLLEGGRIRALIWRMPVRTWLRVLSRSPKERPSGKYRLGGTPQRGRGHGKNRTITIDDINPHSVPEDMESFILFLPVGQAGATETGRTAGTTTIRAMAHKRIAASSSTTRRRSQSQLPDTGR